MHQIIQLLQHDWFWLLQLGCIAIWKPKGVQIAKKYLQNSFDNNKDGAGFAYAQNGKIEIVKGYFDFDEFWKAFNPLQKFAMLVHFRIATHGKIDQDNCHPFPMMGQKYALVHNGVMPSSLHSGKKDESDTKQFAAILSKCIETVPFGHPQFTQFVEEAISYNKVAVLRADGKIWLFNEGKGEWHKGAWYSNRTYAYGAFKKVWESAKQAVSDTSDYWKRMYGHDDQPEYSCKHHCSGWYNEQGEFEPMYDETEELSDEEIAALSEMDLQNNFESMNETEEERHVAKWLAIQDAKSRRRPKVKIVDNYHPHPFVSGSTKGAERGWKEAPSC